MPESRCLRGLSLYTGLLHCWADAPRAGLQRRDGHCSFYPLPSVGEWTVTSIGLALSSAGHPLDTSTAAPLSSAAPLHPVSSAAPLTISPCGLRIVCTGQRQRPHSNRNRGCFR